MNISVIDGGGEKLEVISIDSFQLKRRGDCSHYSRGRLLDCETHAVTCKHCGQTLDAFDCLVEIARGWDRLAWQLKDLEGRTAAAERRLEAVLRDERNARARLRRVSGKEG